MHLVDRTDLFKISNLDLGGKAIVTSLYSNIEREREREQVGRVQGFILEPIESTYSTF